MYGKPAAVKHLATPPRHDTPKRLDAMDPWGWGSKCLTYFGDENVLVVDCPPFAFRMRLQSMSAMTFLCRPKTCSLRWPGLHMMHSFIGHTSFSCWRGFDVSWLFPYRMIMNHSWQQVHLETNSIHHGRRKWQYPNKKKRGAKSRVPSSSDISHLGRTDRYSAFPGHSDHLAG